MRRMLILLIVVSVFAPPVLAVRAEGALAARDLAGLWRAKQVLGPEISGALTIERHADAWTAEIMGWSAPVKFDAAAGASLSFELDEGLGAFRGRLVRHRIEGHWIQPRVAAYGSQFASPVTLELAAPGRWRGNVTPLEDALTFYLSVKAEADGSVTAFLRNPERNAARFLNAGRITVDGGKVTLLGRRTKDGPEGVFAEGTYDAEREILSLYLGGRGGSYDFRRATKADEAGFYPRGRTPAPYVYRAPAPGDDGWPVASLDEVGISRESMTRFVQMLIDTPIDSLAAPDIHGVLIARHGKLVLEEYFHGFHRDALHDTRSSSKSLTSTLVGAAIHRKYPVSLATRAYETMYGRAATDARKQSIAIEHLLTMSSGLNIDDADPNSPGGEDTMQNQEDQPDWYRFALDLDMVRAPGEKAIYGSANPNLAGGVLSKATRRWLPDLFRELVAEPLGIHRYAMNMTPTGDAYMGGGTRFLPRDFMKLAQVMLGGGRWKGRQIVSAEWARRSTSPVTQLNGTGYGYLWWVAEYPYKGRTVQAFYAAGNGGQIAMAVPELDLVIAFWGGNYSSPTASTAQRVYVPEYILPAVEVQPRSVPKAAKRP